MNSLEGKYKPLKKPETVERRIGELDQAHNVNSYPVLLNTPVSNSPLKIQIKPSIHAKVCDFVKNVRSTSNLPFLFISLPLNINTCSSSSAVLNSPCQWEMVMPLLCIKACALSTKFVQFNNNMTRDVYL